MKTIFTILLLCSVAVSQQATPPQSSEHPNWTIIRGALRDNAGRPLLSSRVLFNRSPTQAGPLTLCCLTDDKGLVHGEHGRDCRIPGNDLMQHELKAYTWWNVSAKGLNQNWFIMGNVLNPQALVQAGAKPATLGKPDSEKPEKKLP